MSSNYSHIPKDGSAYTRDGIRAHLTSAEAAPCADRAEALERFDTAVRRFTDYAADHTAAGRWALNAEADVVRTFLGEIAAVRAALEV